MDLDTSDLDRQIASLQAERSKKLLRADQARLAREKEDAKVLVGLTPTKPAQKGCYILILHLPGIRIFLLT